MRYATRATRRSRKPRRHMKEAGKCSWCSLRQAMALTFILHFLRDYCINTSLHGLRYIVEDGRHWTERCIWASLCSMAVVGALFTSSNIWDRYQTSPTMTVLESTNFPIENLPFPAFTICDSNHVRWDKALLFREKYLADADEMTTNAYDRLVASMTAVNFGDFDKIGITFGNDTENAELLENVNITLLMLETMSTCREFFVDKCWWRGANFNCCSLFELQKSEYGFCYSFNSETSQIRGERDDSHQRPCRSKNSQCTSHKELRPRRTSTSGPWSGLRFTVNCFPDQVPPLVQNQSTPGVIIIVSSPYDFPIIGTDIVAGTSAQVSLMAQVTYATPQVRDLSAARRGCLFHDEGEALGFREYRHSNCIAQCHRDSTVQHCNCTPFFYPNDEGQIPVCDTNGLLCLNEFNDVFNYEMPDDDNPFFDDEQDGMQCSCAADCERLEYTSEIYVTAMTGSTRASEDYVQLDIHFKQPAMVKYRTDVVFGWLDLTVSLGGIAGLFLGFSLLSGAEFVYFLTFRMFGLWKQERSKTRYTQQVTPFHIFQQRSNQLHKSDYTDKSIKRILPQPYY